MKNSAFRSRVWVWLVIICVVGNGALELRSIWADQKSAEFDDNIREMRQRSDKLTHESRMLELEFAKSEIEFMIMQAKANIPSDKDAAPADADTDTEAQGNLVAEAK